MQVSAFQLSFNRFLRVAFQGSRVTSDGGLILVRELDERLGFGELIEQHLTDSRGKNTQLPQPISAAVHLLKIRKKWKNFALFGFVGAYPCQ